MDIIAGQVAMHWRSGTEHDIRTQVVLPFLAKLANSARHSWLDGNPISCRREVGFKSTQLHLLLFPQILIRVENCIAITNGIDCTSLPNALLITCASLTDLMFIYFTYKSIILILFLMLFIFSCIFDIHDVSGV
jgi:hypothetical protein